MYIGEAAKQTGLSIKTIRFYESIGLIPEPKRNGRFRVYSDRDVDMLLLIKEAKQLGFTLNQLKSAVVLENDKVDWDKVRPLLDQLRKQLIEQKKDIDKKLALLEECYSQLNCEWPTS